MCGKNMFICANKIPLDILLVYKHSFVPLLSPQSFFLFSLGSRVMNRDAFLWLLLTRSSEQAVQSQACFHTQKQRGIEGIPSKGTMHNVIGHRSQ